MTLVRNVKIQKIEKAGKKCLQHMKRDPGRVEWKVNKADDPALTSNCYNTHQNLEEERWHPRENYKKGEI